MSEQQTIREVEPPAPDAVAETEPADLADSRLYFNRELSWVEFNARVVELCEQTDIPLMERVKFAAIYTSNLDEFFMIRVAGLHDQVDAGLSDPGADGRTPSQVIDELRERILELDGRVCRCVETELRPALAEHGIARGALARGVRRREAGPGGALPPPDLPGPDAAGRRAWVARSPTSRTSRSRSRCSSATPRRRSPRSRASRCPRSCCRGFVGVGDEHDVRGDGGPDRQHLDALFPGMEIVEHGVFRVTRDADFEVSDEADDLLAAVETELRRRRFGEAVRLEVDAGMSDACCASSSSTRWGRGAPGLRGRRAARPHRPLAARAPPGLQRSARGRHGRR